MIEPIFNRQRLYKFFLIPVLLFFSAFEVNQQQNGGIILHDEQIGITPKEFYIADVRDERDNRTAIAWLLQQGNNSATKIAAAPVDFDGGFASIKQFMIKSLPRNTTLRPVVISIKKFVAKETANTDGSTDGRVVLQLSFSLKNSDAENEFVALGDYNGTATYKRAAAPPQDIEPILRQTLAHGITYVNGWMDKQAGTNIKLATGTKAMVTDYAEATEGDSIYYAVNRPLTWDDFHAEAMKSKYDAEVFPILGYDEHIEIINSIINVHLAVKVSLAKSACWVREGARNNAALNHEQRHFDILKVVAERFKQKIRAENLPVNNFDGYINTDYLDAYREMTDLQKQYDDETRHGSNAVAQQRWNELIDQELKTYHIK